MAISTIDLTTGLTTTYVSSGSSAVTIMSLCNRSASTVTVNIHVVPNGDAPSNTNLFIKELELIAGDTYILYQGNEKIILDNGDYIVCQASADNAVSVVTSYMNI